MKKFILRMSIMACFLATFACTKPNTESKQDMHSMRQRFTFSPVRLDTAIWAINKYGCWWRETVQKFKIDTTLITNFPPRSFLISGGDLIGVLSQDTTEILAQCPFKRGRAYMGMLHNEVHLYFTPVDSLGNDTILVDGSGRQIAYDLVLPCPNTCDFVSPLYTAFNLSCPPNPPSDNYYGRGLPVK